MTTDLLLWQ